MVYGKIEIGGKEIVCCADDEEEHVEIKLWVNNMLISLPIVYEGELTIQLTEAGLAALESFEDFQDEDIEKVEFAENDGSLDHAASYINEASY